MKKSLCLIVFLCVSFFCSIASVKENSATHKNYIPAKRCGAVLTLNNNMFGRAYISSVLLTGGPSSPLLFTARTEIGSFNYPDIITVGYYQMSIRIDYPSSSTGVNGIIEITTSMGFSKVINADLPALSYPGHKDLDVLVPVDCGILTVTYKQF